MNLFEAEELRGKTQPITLEQVAEAYRLVKANRGAAGVDGQTLADFDADKIGQLYQLWNRMASGSYFPQAVRGVEIPKKDGSYRLLGIPTVSDRTAQQVVRSVLEPIMEQVFDEDSYGYRPGKSAHQTVAKCEERCRQYRWVIDMDIKGFFDNIDHDLMMQVLRHYTSEKWILIYVERWLTCPMVMPEGRQIERTLNARLVRWITNKYKRYRRRKYQAWQKLKEIARDFPNLFEHWKYGYTP